MEKGVKSLKEREILVKREGNHDHRRIHGNIQEGSVQQ